MHHLFLPNTGMFWKQCMCSFAYINTSMHLYLGPAAAAFEAGKTMPRVSGVLRLGPYLEVIVGAFRDLLQGREFLHRLDIAFWDL